MDIEIRYSKHSEVQQLLAIHQSEIGSNWSHEDFTKYIENNNKELYTIKTDGIIIGYIMLTLIHPEAEIINIAISTEFQNRGLGSSVMNFIADELSEKNYQAIHLEVRESSKAHNFYKKNNFFQVGIRKGYYQNGEDAILLTRTLKLL